ncbi:hypothetical protein [Nostoc flagelliforme]|nr:hypothetical protein [Nostoc flagelliforme]
MKPDQSQSDNSNGNLMPPSPEKTEWFVSAIVGDHEQLLSD